METGDKKFELRKDDRPFSNGDMVLLQEYEPEEKTYTGAELPFIITFILRDENFFGLKSGFCILGLKSKEDGY